MATGDSIQAATDLLGAALAPLGSATDSPESAAALIEGVGWTDLPLVPTALLDLNLSVQGLLSAQADLLEARLALEEGLGSEGNVTGALIAVVAQVGLVISDIKRQRDAFQNELPQAYLDATDIASQVEERLLDWLVVEALDSVFPAARRVLWVLGILDVVQLEDDPNAYQVAIALHKTHWSRIGQLLTDPSGLMADVYGWGTPNLNTERLFEVLFSLSFEFATPAERRFASAAFLNAIAPGAEIPEDQEPMLVLPLPFGKGAVLDLALVAAPKQTESESQGLALHLVGTANLGVSYPLGAETSVHLTLDADMVSGVGGVLRPGSGLTLVGSPDVNPVAFTGGRLAARLALAAETEGVRRRLLTIPGGATVDAHEVFLEASIEGTRSPPDLQLLAGVTGGHLAFPSEGHDGFTRTLLPSGGIGVDFDLGIGWSQQRGVFFTGSGGLTAAIPVNATLGPFFLDLIRVGIAADTSQVSLTLGLVGGATLGPVTVIVDAIGASAQLQFQSGNLGPLQLDAALSAPRGYGIRVDAGPVVGGGFVYFDDPTYFGALELSVFGIAVKAFALIETVLPDGREGFSFAIIISAEFTPIQLGFGFTLLGVGGLVGIHRTVNVEALGNAARTGSLAHLLFPRNVVQDAPAIVHDLATVFPAARDHYIFGPMAKFGWGTPTLITGSFGVLIEFPGPRIGLIGVVSMQLPDPEAAILSLQMAIQGFLDFPAKLLTVDAGLFDSFVAGFAVAGDMAYRLGFGDKAKFLMSIGGFNPDFDAPAGFPVLRRASVELGVNGNPSLTASGYFALTSNTAQIGARIDLRASGFGIRLTGWLGFDALFVFSPFSFTASFSAGMRVSFHGAGIGVTLHGTLKGTNPWMISGKVCVSVLFWDACLSVEHTFGNRNAAALPELDPWEGFQSDDPRLQVVGMRAAVSDARNWSGTNPPAGFSVVTLSEATTVGRTPIDPLGAATLRQRVAPLGEVLTKFGEYKPIINNEFTVESVKFDEQEVTSRADVEDDFAPAHFFELSKAERLSTESYQKMRAGFTIDPERTAVGSADSTTVDYETDFVTVDGDLMHDDVVYRPSQALISGLLKNLGKLKGVRQTGARKFVTPNKAKKVTFGPARYVVVDSCTSVPNTAILGTETTQIAALLALRKHVGANPADFNRYQVAPKFAVPTTMP